MNKKQLILGWVIILGLTFLLFKPTYASWTEYKPARYMDLDGDFKNEIIIETKNGAGSGHYIEVMRIFKDDYHNLKLIFEIFTLDSVFGEGPGNDDISTVEFTEQNPQTGLRDIIVKSKRIYYKDDQNKIIDREEEQGSKIFKWNGKVFVEIKQNNINKTKPQK